MLENYHDGILEEDLLAKLQNNFMDRFCLEQNRACELALEVLDMLAFSDSNLKTLSHYYLT